jgi:hypothetical protein
VVATPLSSAGVGPGVGASAWACAFPEKMIALARAAAVADLRRERPLVRFNFFMERQF